jgi:hypothetical protein
LNGASGALGDRTGGAGVVLFVLARLSPFDAPLPADHPVERVVHANV